MWKRLPQRSDFWDEGEEVFNLTCICKGNLIFLERLQCFEKGFSHPLASLAPLKSAAAPEKPPHLHVNDIHAFYKESKSVAQASCHFPL